MTTDYTALIERLEGWRLPLLDEAASALRDLQAKLAEAERDATVANYQRALEASQRGQQLALAERDRLRAALEKIGNCTEAGCNFESWVGMLRFARAALEGKP
jgi:hypothetical protein